MPQPPASPSLRVGPAGQAPPSVSPDGRARLWRVVGWAGVAAALGMVFAWYLSPHLVVDLATRVWACF